MPGLGFGAEPGELLVEASADGFGQRGGPATGGAGTDEGFEFLQGGKRRGLSCQSPCFTDGGVRRWVNPVRVSSLPRFQIYFPR